MRRVLLSLLVVVLFLAVLGAAGYVGYQYGYRQGAVSALDDSVQLPPGHPDITPRGMRMHDFGFDHGFGGFGIRDHGIGFGFGFFSPLFFLLRLAFWGLVIWAIYMLITRSGWRLTRATPTVTTTTTESTVGENRESDAP
jgi:hypothetical protein